MIRDWLSKFSAPRVSDPVFGSLKFESRSWYGRVALEDGSAPVDLMVNGTRAGPAESCRQAFLEMRSRYLALKPMLASTLFELYSNCYENMGDSEKKGWPLLSEAAQIWPMVRVTTVAIEQDAESESPQVSFSYSLEWDLNHVVTIWIHDWSVAGVTIDG